MAGPPGRDVGDTDDGLCRGHVHHGRGRVIGRWTLSGTLGDRHSALNASPSRRRLQLTAIEHHHMGAVPWFRESIGNVFCTVSKDSNDSMQAARILHVSSVPSYRIIL